MGKNKLRKFADIDSMDFVHQYPFARLRTEGFPLRGRWRSDFFHRPDTHIILELGCGKGEYTVGLARVNRDDCFIGIDIKGARMWTGACQARSEQLTNVSFVRTDIELLPEFFAPGEVDEIWITFPDPQMKKTRKRLTSTRFMEFYRQVLRPGGIIRLKTDSPFLYTYTRRMAALNSLPVETDCPDVHGGRLADDPTLTIRTHYEQQWIDRGLTIKYLAFALPHEGRLSEPETDDIPLDTYRSYSRGVVQCPEKCDSAVIERAGTPIDL